MVLARYNRSLHQYRRLVDRVEDITVARVLSESTTGERVLSLPDNVHGYTIQLLAYLLQCCDIWWILQIFDDIEFDALSLQ